MENSLHLYRAFSFYNLSSNTEHVTVWFSFTCKLIQQWWRQKGKRIMKEIKIEEKHNIKAWQRWWWWYALMSWIWLGQITCAVLKHNWIIQNNIKSAQNKAFLSALLQIPAQQPHCLEQNRRNLSGHFRVRAQLYRLLILSTCECADGWSTTVRNYVSIN